jgi:hypothetical protein
VRNALGAERAAQRGDQLPVAKEFVEAHGQRVSFPA